MDPSSKHPARLRVAAVVSFYMFAALVVRPFFGLVPLVLTSAHPSLDGFCVRLALDLLA
jgi:hypothetical protein